jgi:hypothetical protein
MGKGSLLERRVSVPELYGKSELALTSLNMALLPQSSSRPVALPPVPEFVHCVPAASWQGVDVRVTTMPVEELVPAGTTMSPSGPMSLPPCAAVTRGGIRRQDAVAVACMRLSLGPNLPGTSLQTC